MRFFRGLLILIAILAILGAGLLAAFRDPDVPASMLVAKYGQGASQFITLPSGANVHFRDQGQRLGPVLVLLHGSNASLHTWEPWVAALGDQFRVISVDLPAHGLTGPVPGDDYSEEGMVKFVYEFTAALKLAPFTLAGNSMGGGVAARFAIEHPERLTNLILVDAGGMPSASPRDPGLGFRLARMPIVQNLMLYVTPPSLFEDSLKKAIFDDTLVTPAMVDRYWELNRREGNRAASLKRFQTEQDTFVQDNAAKIATPTLILWRLGRYAHAGRYGRGLCRRDPELEVDRVRQRRPPSDGRSGGPIRPRRPRVLEAYPGCRTELTHRFANARTTRAYTSTFCSKAAGSILSSVSFAVW